MEDRPHPGRGGDLDPEALREKLGTAPRHGANARLLLLNAARALAADEEASGIRPGKGTLQLFTNDPFSPPNAPACTSMLRLQALVKRSTAPYYTLLARHPIPTAAPAPRCSEAAAARSQPREQQQLSGSQLLALVPQKARPWVPYNPRACTTQQARQQLAGVLAGSYLSLLVRELKLLPVERAKQVVLNL